MNSNRTAKDSGQSNKATRKATWSIMVVRAIALIRPCFGFGQCGMWGYEFGTALEVYAVSSILRTVQSKYLARTVANIAALSQAHQS